MSYVHYLYISVNIRLTNFGMDALLHKCQSYTWFCSLYIHSLDLLAVFFRVARSVHVTAGKLVFH